MPPSYLSSSLWETSKGPFVLVDYVILTAAIIGNLFALNAIVKTKFGLTSYRIFLISLATSDLFLCWVSLVYTISQTLADRIFDPTTNQIICFGNAVRGLLLFSVFANLYNLIGMSFDHFVGIVYPLRYRYMVNKAIARTAIALIWLFAFISGFADIPILAAAFVNRPPRRNLFINKNCSTLQTATPPIEFEHDVFDSFGSVRKKRAYSVTKPPAYTPPHSTYVDWNSIDIRAVGEMLSARLNPSNSSLFSGCDEADKKEQLLREMQNMDDPYRVDDDDWCGFVNERKIWLELSAVAWTIISFFILALCYGRIFKMVVIQRKNRSIRKLIITTCLLLGMFAILWLPFMVFEITMWIIVSQSIDYQRSDGLFVAHNVFNTMFMLHPLLNPIIYVARLPNIRRSILLRYGSLFPCLRKCLHEHRNSSATQHLVLSMTTSLRKISRPNMANAASIDAFDQATSNYGNHYVSNFVSRASPEHGNGVPDVARQRMVERRNSQHTVTITPSMTTASRRDSSELNPLKPSLGDYQVTEDDVMMAACAEDGYEMSPVLTDDVERQRNHVLEVLENEGTDDL